MKLKIALVIVALSLAVVSTVANRFDDVRPRRLPVPTTRRPPPPPTKRPALPLELVKSNANVAAVQNGGGNVETTPNGTIAKASHAGRKASGGVGSQKQRGSQQQQRNQGQVKQNGGKQQNRMRNSQKNNGGSMRSKGRNNGKKGKAAQAGVQDPAAGGFIGADGTGSDPAYPDSPSYGMGSGSGNSYAGGSSGSGEGGGSHEYRG